jgi:WD40 repeat protein/serine/threonine protein kinase
MREYDLLVGILACQLRLVSRGTLVRYAALLTERPASSLLDYLLDSKALSENDQQFLCRIVDTIIHAHHGDERAAFKAFGGEEAASDAFAGSIVHSDSGWGPSEDQTILADQLPHGLPPQILPETIGRYTRGSEYARGGIGRILLVHDEQIGRDVILKELLPEHTVSPTASTLSQMPKGASPKSPMRKSASMMARFLQEAKITGQLEHPSIVPVYELGTRKDGQLYYTMKLVRGDTLSVAIKDCKSLQDRLALLRSFLDVCQAMAYAHTKGVIHRDLKPSNIMVGEFGECVVLDWGLAKMQRDVDAHREALEKTISQLKLGDDQVAGMQTRSKDVLGTPLYMAPEQARGEVDGVGLHSDVYSLGVILYEILSGDLPHPWSNSLDTIRRVGSLPAPPLRKAAPETPPELAAICDKALSFDARKRYPSAKELATDMQHFLEGAVVGAYAYKFTDLLGRLYKKHRPIILTITTAALILLIVGVLSYVSIYIEREKAVKAEGKAREALGVAQQERDKADAERSRATAAEARTAQEKYVSDIRLADAYIRELKLQSAEDTLLQTLPEYRGLEWEYLLSQCNQEMASLKGHTRDIFAFLSPDATHTLTLSGDGTARLWDNANDQTLYTWSLSDSPISGGAFSPSGLQVAVWMHDGSIHLFDTTTGAVGPIWKAHAQRVLQCAFSADGKLLASTGDEKTVRLWSVDTQESRWQTALDTPAYSIDFCENDSKLLAIPDKGSPAVLDTATGNIDATSTHTGQTLWSEDGTVIISTGNDLLILSAPDLARARRVPVGGGVNRTRYYPRSGELLTGNAVGVITLWDVNTGTIKQNYNLMRPVHTCRLDHSGSRVIAVSYDGRIRTFDKITGDAELDLSGHRHQITTVDIAPDDSYILTASVDGTAKRWSMATPASFVARFQSTPGSILAGLAENGEHAVLANAPGRVDVHSLRSNVPKFTAQTPDPFGSPRAALSPDGSLLALVLDRFLPVIIAMSDQSVVATLEGHRGFIYSMEFSAQGGEIVTTSWDNTARIWDTRTGETLGILTGHQDTVYDAAWSPDGSRLITVSLDRTAIVWDRSSLTPMFTIPHDEKVTCCAFSPDGKLVATGSRGGTIKVWSVEDNALKYTLKEQTPQIMELDFSADSQRLLSPISANKLALWDMRLGVRLSNLTGAGESSSKWCRFNRPGNSMLSAGQDGIVREHLPLVTPEAPPILDKQSLTTALETYRSTRAAQPAIATTNAAGETTDLYLPAPTVTALLGHLQDSTKQRADADAPLTFNEAIDGYYPFRIQAGDTISTVANLTPEALFSAANEATLQPLLTGEQTFTIDLLRNEALSRFRLHGLPVRRSEQTVTLTPERAIVLLQAALDTIRNDATTLLQVTQDQTPPGSNPTRGIQIPTPREADGKALLLEAGLVSGTRLVAINGEPVPSLDGLAEMLDQAASYVRDSGRFRIEFTIECGLFGVFNMTLQSS